MIPISLLILGAVFIGHIVECDTDKLGVLTENRPLYDEILTFLPIFFSMLRWTRDSEEYQIKEGEISLEKAVIHYLGGDIHLLQDYRTQFEQRRQESIDMIENTESPVGLGVQVALDFYTALLFFLDKYTADPTGTSITNCRSSLLDSDWTITETEFDESIRMARESGSRTMSLLHELLEDDFAAVSTHQTLYHFAFLQKLRGESLLYETMLLKVQKAGIQYLSYRSKEKDEETCDVFRPHFRATLFIEKTLLRYLSKSKYTDNSIGFCYQKIEEFRLMTLEAALEYLNECLNDKEVTEAAFGSEIKNDDYQLAMMLAKLKTTSKSKLRLLSWSFVQDILLSKIKVKDCTDCQCALRAKLEELRRCVERIRELLNLPDEGAFCNSSWGTEEYSLLNSADGKLPDFLLINQEQLIPQDVRDVHHLTDIFGISDDMLKPWYWGPFVGIPYLNFPTMAGLWWISSYFFDIQSCDQFRDIQILRILLSKYGEVNFYVIDRAYLPICNRLSVTEPIQSVAMSSVLISMSTYEEVRKFDPIDLSVLFEQSRSNDGKPGTINSFQLSTAALFADFIDESLPVDPEYFQVGVTNFTKTYVKGFKGSDFDHLVEYVLQHYNESCATCSIIDLLKRNVDITRSGIYNHWQGRIYPIPLENEQYTQARSNVVSKDAEQFSLNECQENVEQDLNRYRLAAFTFWHSPHLDNEYVFEDIQQVLDEENTLQYYRDRIKVQSLRDFADYQYEWLQTVGKKKENLSIIANARRMLSIPSYEKAETELQPAWDEQVRSKICLIMRMGVFDFYPRNMMSPVDCSNVKDIYFEKFVRKVEEKPAKPRELQNSRSISKQIEDGESSEDKLDIKLSRSIPVKPGEVESYSNTGQGNGQSGSSRKKSKKKKKMKGNKKRKKRKKKKKTED